MGCPGGEYYSKARKTVAVEAGSTYESPGQRGRGRGRGGGWQAAPSADALGALGWCCRRATAKTPRRSPACPSLPSSYFVALTLESNYFTTTGTVKLAANGTLAGTPPAAAAPPPAGAAA